MATERARLPAAAMVRPPDPVLRLDADTGAVGKPATHVAGDHPSRQCHEGDGKHGAGCAPGVGVHESPTMVRVTAW
jgi:hypothetical protein